MKTRRAPSTLVAALALALTAGGCASRVPAAGGALPPPTKLQQSPSAQAGHPAKKLVKDPHMTGPYPLPSIAVPHPLPEVTYANNWPLGIFPDHLVGFLAHMASINAWHGVVDGVDVAVIAGSKAETSKSEPDSTGKIVVQKDILGPNTPNGTFTPYYDSAIPGPYTIVSASGNVVTLTDGDGAKFTFDANNDTFGK